MHAIFRMTVLSTIKSRTRRTLPLRRCARPPSTKAHSRSRSRSRSRSHPLSMDTDSDESRDDQMQIDSLNAFSIDHTSTSTVSHHNHSIMPPVTVGVSQSPPSSLSTVSKQGQDTNTIPYPPSLSSKSKPQKRARVPPPPLPFFPPPSLSSSSSSTVTHCSVPIPVASTASDCEHQNLRNKKVRKRARRKRCTRSKSSRSIDSTPSSPSHFNYKMDQTAHSIHSMASVETKELDFHSHSTLHSIDTKPHHQLQSDHDHKPDPQLQAQCQHQKGIQIDIAQKSSSSSYYDYTQNQNQQDNDGDDDLYHQSLSTVNSHSMIPSSSIPMDDDIAMEMNPNDEIMDGDTDHDDTEDTDDTDEDRLRTFRFSIEDDANLQELVDGQRRGSLSSTTQQNGTNTHHQTSLVVAAQSQSQQQNGTDHNTANETQSQSVSSQQRSGSEGVEVSSDYILSKLYNYMKISEMSKYGIQVFEMTFSSYLPFLTEADLFRLATSYWCNGAHFNCMTAHRGDRIKASSTSSSSSLRESGPGGYGMASSRESGHGNGGGNGGRNGNGNGIGSAPVLTLEITNELLDAAMQSGASVDKIEAMLLQKREDDGTMRNRNLCAVRCGRGQRWRCRKDGKLWFYQSKEERAFYLRNLKHRFWNHEVLVRVFIQNGWMTPDLAEYAMKTFIKTIYHRVLQSKAPKPKNGGGVKLSESFLQSFFAEHFCLDDIPKMYREEIRKREQRHTLRGQQQQSHHLSEETLRRWCELIELLASRGASVHSTEFGQMIPLQYALQIGRNTFKVISSTHKAKNKMFIPQHFLQENITVPDDIWDVLVSYL